MATRGLVVAKNGVAATSQPLATAAALAILGRGGTFADAAIAASAVLCVIEPWNSHLGGDAFLIVHDAQTRKTLAYNASGAAPKSASLASYRAPLPIHGARAATVPGLVDAWFALHQRHGSLPFSDLLSAAIGYARDGYPAGPRAVKKFAEFAHLSGLEALGTKTPTLGELVRQPDLAWSLEELAQHGREAFYSGAIAQKIVAASKGHFTLDDLAAHKTRILAPLSVGYRGLTVHCQPPPSQGMILAQELALAEGFALGELDEDERTHLLVECKKRAFADRFAHLADPEWHEIPLERLLSEPYLAKRRAEIGESATVMPSPTRGGQGADEGQDTTYFLVADKNGNAVSFIQSIFHNFGSAWIPEGTGILFNNRLTGFSLDPKSPNVLAPGKRPAHTLNAWLATNPDGTLALVGGTPGANIQVQTNLQLLVNTLDLDLDPQEAVERPRWQHSSDGGNTGQSEEGLGILELEDRAAPALFGELVERGHDVRPIGGWAHGSAAQLLKVLPSGAYAVGSDPRCDGQAGGL
ncbi:gamma-glutamyltransferase family protein [Armatimonas rosea]|uniref:Gamma-glutamyltranspeptidase/glutathione hydrolase n=1 Tax=Armatimonas rosea TaxID=685828 RepID=A0A7W9W3I2_ARMRO|nr:gamma-glutamyltransferase family protein [Armatimonas rosea]MBB6048439.1 gamma-glutamyltranspeptidase/glutathione hydrolase [Armatimonas rosea]